MDYQTKKRRMLVEYLQSPDFSWMPKAFKWLAIISIFILACQTIYVAVYLLAIIYS